MFATRLSGSFPRIFAKHLSLQKPPWPLQNAAYLIFQNWKSKTNPSKRRVGRQMTPGHSTGVDALCSQSSLGAALSADWPLGVAEQAIC